MADDNARELQKREARAFEKKANLDALNQELALNFYPERADFTGERALGEEFAIDLYDSEPLRCRRGLGDARASMLRPGGQKWSLIQTLDERINELPHVARFFDWMNDRFRARIYHQNTGFVDCEKTADHDLVTFGGGVKTAESEIDRNGERVPVMRPWHPRDCAYFDDLTGVRQDTMFRRFNASARHIKQKFPDAELHSTIQKAIEKEPDREFKLCHTMMLADEYEYYKKPRGARTQFVSVYYDSEHKMLLRERPSRRFRYVVDRWHRIPGSQYPYSPAATTSLPDARGIQTMAMVLLEAGEKSLDPPMRGIRKAVIGEVRSGAGEITWIDGDKYNEKMGDPLAPLLPHNQNLAIGIDLINRTTFGLRDNWYLTKLTLPQHAKTAYETAQLVEEFIRANIPLFEPWEAGTAMMLEEIFGVLMDMGEFGDFEDWPAELSDSDLVFTFSNPLRDAIERNKANQATAVLGLLAGAAQVNPEAPGARRYDMDKMIADAGKGTGHPADWLKDEEQAAEEARQKQMEGDIVKALQGAGAAAEVANTGLDAATKLQDLRAEPVGGGAPYGPT